MMGGQEEQKKYTRMIPGKIIKWRPSSSPWPFLISPGSFCPLAFFPSVSFFFSSSFSPLTPGSSLGNRRYPSLYGALRIAYRIEKNQQLKGTPEGWLSNFFAQQFQWIPPSRCINKPRQTGVELLNRQHILGNF